MDISKLQPDSWSHVQSIVSKGRFKFEYEGINVHKIRLEKIKR